MKVGVVGAGPTGLAAAHTLVKAGHEVAVFEKNAELGGLAASILVQGTPLERYYHHLFATDAAIIRLIDELGLRDDLQFRALATGIYHGGRLHAFGTPWEMLRFAPLPVVDRVRFAATSAYLKAVKRYERLEGTEALAWASRYAGPRVTDVIWRPLLEGKFGERAGDVSMAWLWARVHYRTFKLGYLNGGFERLYAALGRAVVEGGGKILFGKSLESIERDGSKVRVAFGDGFEDRVDRAIVTTPPSELARATGSAPEGSPPEYLGATCFVLELERSLIPYYWLNVNDPEFPFLVVVEHTRMVDRSQYGGRHVVYVGNYVDTADWRFATDPDVLLDRYVPYLRMLSPGFTRDDVAAWHFSRAPFAQPVVTVDYRARIPPHATDVPGVFLASMAQVYPQDRGQNYAVAMGQRIASEIAAGAS